MLMMMNEEKQPVNVLKQPIVFFMVVSVLFLLLLLFNSDVFKTIILFYLFSLSIYEDK